MGLIKIAHCSNTFSAIDGQAKMNAAADERKCGNQYNPCSNAGECMAPPHGGANRQSSAVSHLSAAQPAMMPPLHPGGSGPYPTFSPQVTNMERPSPISCRPFRSGLPLFHHFKKQFNGRQAGGGLGDNGGNDHKIG